ncbi:MAG: MOSC N-terminal beta barrel domain-containing protein [Candidatus Krumholzibacteriota bacterium]
MDIRLSAIHLYPVKGIRGVSVAAAQVERAGLRHDRRWIIVDERGKFISQRTHPRLALISGNFDGDRLELAGPGREPFQLKVPAGNHRAEVTVWNDRVDAAVAGPQADRWLSAFLDQPCRLAYLDDAAARPITSAAGRPAETVSFADGYPCLLTSTASVTDLNGRLDDPVPMDRFRPNLVVTGTDAFAEDSWAKVAIGEAVFRVAGPCSRCGVTTVDQATGERASEEPLRTLATYRQTAKGIEFGINLVPEREGTISVGDEVRVEE